MPSDKVIAPVVPLAEPDIVCTSLTTGIAPYTKFGEIKINDKKIKTITCW